MVQFLGSTIGIILFDLGQVDKVVEVHRQVLADRRLLASKFPSTLSYRLELGDSLYNLAITYMRLGDESLSEAEKMLQEGLTVRKQLAAELPTVPDYQSKLGTMQDAFALLLRRQRQPARALKVLQDSLRCHQNALRQQPGNEIYRRFFADHYSVVAETLLQQSKHVEAKLAAEEMVKLSPPREPSGYYRAAVILARCKENVEADGALSKEKKKPVVDRYALRAIELLRQAIQNGFQDWMRLERNPSFKSLKNDPLFQQLCAQLKEKPAVIQP